MAVGGRGLVSVSSNEIPAEMSRLVELAEQGDFAGARALHQRLMPLHTKLFIEPNPIAVKWGLAALGKIRNELRLPLVPLSPQHHDRIRGALREAGAVA